MLNKRNIEIFYLICCFVILVPISLVYSQNKELKKVTFLPLWIPQEQFAGYYMAKEKGIYEKYGLDVKILQGGVGNDIPAMLKDGIADFGVMFLYSGVIERASGMNIVNIGQIFQQSDMIFVAKKKSGIKTINDFNGKKIGIWRTVAKELTSGFLQSHNIKATIIEFDKGINLFLKDAVDIVVMMNYNEYSRMINSGINEDEVVKFKFSDYNLNFPEDGIYCMNDTYVKDPDLCKNFVKASIEGWQYSLNNIDETVKVLDKYKELAKVSYNRVHSLWMLKSMKKMLYPAKKNVGAGVLLEADFDSLSNFLYKNKFINHKPSFSDFYKGGK